MLIIGMLISKPLIVRIGPYTKVLQWYLTNIIVSQSGTLWTQASRMMQTGAVFITPWPIKIDEWK